MSKRRKVKRNVSTWNGKVIVCKWKKVNEIASKMLIKVTLQGGTSINWKESNYKQECFVI